MKPSFLESLERIKEEHSQMANNLNQQRVSLKFEIMVSLPFFFQLELDKITAEKEQNTRHFAMYSEVGNTMRSDLRKAEDINKRLQEFILQSVSLDDSKIVSFCEGHVVVSMFRPSL